jgi:hypothetical protein
MENVVEEKDTVKIVLWSKNGRALPTRSVSGLTPEEQRAVREGVPVLLPNPCSRRACLQAVWSGGKIRTRRPSRAVLDAWHAQRDVAAGTVTTHEPGQVPAPKAKTYKIEVKRVRKDYATIRVAAESQEMAEHAANEIAWEHTLHNATGCPVPWRCVPEHIEVEVIDTREICEAPEYTAYAEGWF